MCKVLSKTSKSIEESSTAVLLIYAPKEYLAKCVSRIKGRAPVTVIR